MSSSKASNKPRLQRLRASCDGCFLAKVKCSKSRPICSRCLTCGTDCHYSPSSRAGKPRADRQIGQSNINVNITNQGINIDEGLHPDFLFDPQAMSIPPEGKKSPGFAFDTNWSVSSGSADESRQRSSANTSPSLRDDTFLDCDMGLQSSNSEFFDPLFPWTPIPQNELDSQAFPNDHLMMMPRSRSLGAVQQLNAIPPWFDGQQSNLSFSPIANLMDLPSPNQFFIPSSPPDHRSLSKVSSSSCNCFTTCLQSLQALHNHSSTAQSVPAFDVVLTINRKAVEGCARMLACSKCASKSGSNTTAMLLATIMEKILSLYQAASQNNFAASTAADAQMSIGSYRVANEDGCWLRIEILWRELRKLEELFGRFREVWGGSEGDEIAGVNFTLLGHLSQSLNFTFEVLKMQQNSFGRLE